MGSKIGGGSLSIQIEASDGDNEIFSSIELLKNGIVIETWTPGATNPNVSATATGTDEDYFYVRVNQSGEDGWQAISSPIFIISDDNSPVVTITEPAEGSPSVVTDTVTSPVCPHSHQRAR